jgi:hypothetical protein
MPAEDHDVSQWDRSVNPIRVCHHPDPPAAGQLAQHLALQK